MIFWFCVLHRDALLGCCELKHARYIRNAQHSLRHTYIINVTTRVPGSAWRVHGGRNALDSPALHSVIDDNTTPNDKTRVTRLLKPRSFKARGVRPVHVWAGCECGAERVHESVVFLMSLEIRQRWSAHSLTRVRAADAGELADCGVLATPAG